MKICRSVVGRAAQLALLLVLAGMGSATNLWAQTISDQGICNGALISGILGSATGCGAVITVTAVNGAGQATAFTVTIPNNGGPGNGNPYDGEDDILVGIVNNSSGNLSSITLNSTDTTFGGIFGFDGDGPCDYAYEIYGSYADCYNAGVPVSSTEADPLDYEGPDNTFTIGAETPCTTFGTCFTSGTVNFITPIPRASSCDQPCNSTWFALEGTPNSLTLTSESAMLAYSPSTTPETQTASFGSGNFAHTAAYTLQSVINTMNVNVTANYEATEFSNGGITGPGIVDGICEFGSPTLPGGGYPDDDIDCRLAAGGWVFDTLPNGDQVVLLAFPYHMGQAVWYRASTTAVAVSQGGHDYTGPVYDAWTFAVNPSLANPSPNLEYLPGWNNLIGRVLDRPGTLPNSTTPNPNNAFVADITDFFSGEPAGGGHQSTLNDWVLAAVPNGFGDTEITLVPIPAISPATYIKGLPMLVALDLEKLGTKIPDPTALVKPNALTISTSTRGSTPVSIPVQFPQGFPTTFSNVCTKQYCPLKGVYYIFLSSTPYSKGVVYNMYISSDLFPQVTLPFVVK